MINHKLICSVLSWFVSAPLIYYYFGQYYRNISTQHCWTQHVARVWLPYMLGDVYSILKTIKFFMQHFGMMY